MVLIMHWTRSQYWLCLVGTEAGYHVGWHSSVVTMETRIVLYKGGLCCLVCKVSTTFFISYL